MDTFLKAKYYTQMSTNPVNVDNTPGKLVIETHLYDKVPGVYDLWLYEEKENTSFHKVYLGDSLALLPPPSIKHRMLDRLIKNITNEVVAGKY